jgi:hypothetical protein
MSRPATRSIQEHRTKGGQKALGALIEGQEFMSIDVDERYKAEAESRIPVGAAGFEPATSRV